MFNVWKQSNKGLGFESEGLILKIIKDKEKGFCL